MSYKDKLHSISSKMEKDSVMILFSKASAKRNGDVQYRFRNTSSLIYLTGLNIENLIIVINNTNEILAYMNYPDPAIERWQGKMLSPDDLALNLQINRENIKEYSKFYTDLNDIIKNKKILYIDFSLENEIIEKVLKAANQLNKNNRDKTYGPMEIIHSGKLLNDLRTLKSHVEIEKIKQAIHITGNGFSEVMKWTRNQKEPVFEYQIKAKIEEAFQFNGSQDLAYPTIVAGGNNANYLHYEKCTEMVSDDALVLIDAGTEWNHYASDITRTFPLKGKFTPAQKELYELVLSSQKVAIKSCTLKNSFEDMHQATVRHLVEGLWSMGFFKKIPDLENEGKEMTNPSSVDEVIEKKHYRLYYMHYTSHYLGLDVHDVGRYYLGDNSRKFENGMVFTIEPGLYIQKDYDFIPDDFRGIGIRIEDDIAMINDKAENLSQSIPKEVEEIEGLSNG